MTNDEFKQRAESFSERYQLWKVNLPGPWTAVLTLAELVAYVVVIAVIYRAF